MSSNGGAQAAGGGRALSWVLLALFALGSLACAPYYLVESQLIESSRVDQTADVTATSAYRSMLSKKPRVALAAPDRCADASAAAADGQSMAGGQILRTECGVEMAQLERALARVGYSVSSWKAVHQMVDKEKLTPLAAADRLEADVLFQVNSLERSRTDPGREMRWERRFYKSNKKGTKGEPAGVGEKRALSLEGLATAQENRLEPKPRLSATVNANAVLVETGESIWFYEHTQVETYDRAQVALTLAKCRRSGCEPRIPEKEEEDEVKTIRYGSIQAVSSGPSVASAEAALYHDLMSSLIDDLVRQFSGGSR